MSDTIKFKAEYVVVIKVGEIVAERIACTALLSVERVLIDDAVYRRLFSVSLYVWRGYWERRALLQCQHI